MTTSEELNRLATVPYFATYYALLRQAACEIEALHKENAELRKDIPTADATVWRDACNKARDERDQLRAQAEALRLDFNDMKGRFCEHHATPGACTPGCPECERGKLRSIVAMQEKP